MEGVRHAGCVHVRVMKGVHVKGFWDTCFLGKKCGGGIDGHRVEMGDESTTLYRENGEMNDMQKSTPI